MSGSGKNNGKEAREIIFRVLESSRIPKKTFNRKSRYEPIVRALVENQGRVIEIKGASSSGLKRAIEKYLGKGKVTVAERKGKIYALYTP